jgi:AraC-like DNA-binding protein/mannose-6-phosphate isomerase-like protein (cupin superfamily)
MSIPVYGIEHTFLEKETGLLYRNSCLKETAPLHTHNFFEFFIVTDGTALHLINSSIQTLTKGDLVFIRPQDAHSYDFYYSEDFRILNVGFSNLIFQSIKSFLENTEKLQRLIEIEFPECVHTDDAALEHISYEFKQIGNLMQKSHTKRTTFHTKCYLASIFVDYFFQYSDFEQKTRRVPQWFDRMIIEMQRIENLQIGFSKMIELSACSKNHLCRVFKNSLSVTPTEYINDKRLEYSVYLLTQTTDDILEICECCGFKNLSYFYH